MHEISSFFVYGTLKKSQLRGGLWPRRPLEIFPSVIQADLYDLGPYPAAVPGTGWILGEVWQFESADVEPTLSVLDRIEGFDDSRDDNEYVRKTVNASFMGSTGNVMDVMAFAYFAGASGSIQAARRISPFTSFLGRRVAAWPDAMSRVPSSFAEE